MAQDYIYIEDQYFYSAEVSEALVSALRARPQLFVIVVVPREPTDDHLPATANYYQARAIQRLVDGLQGTAGASHFAFYELRNLEDSTQQVYVHAKLMIVDDVWVEIGSMNCNIRSMTHDIEACVAVVDGETESSSRGQICKFARDLRKRLWAEHLGLEDSDPSIQDPISGVFTWAQRAGQSGVRAILHVTPPNQSNFRGNEDTWLKYIDPQGTCSGAQKIPAP